ncbi:uncharacterized protein LOC123692730 [Colias croceus]|uniref:uncharacterized protein LOC123692730 n=1 Tax=Colias crocea TaxID=72248 RepID=UPI001E281969|nr:uncharacterized protein LOC123692730 [Colias croceus]
MESYIKVQSNIYERITKARSNFKKSPKERLSNDAYLSTRLDALEELWSQFLQTHTQIIQVSESDKLNATTYVKADTYGNCEEQYIDYKYELREARANLTVKSTYVHHAADGSTTATDSNQQGFKLPKIAIPHFSGKYTEWTSFRDLFLSLVHSNPTLDDVQRLHYLKCQLTGEAERFLRHIPITAENYKLCWKQLEDRYSNKKYLANCILKKFMNQKTVTTESATALRELLDNTNECHNVYSCPQSSRCRICKKKHHSLLHPKNVSLPSVPQMSEAEPDAKEATASTSTQVKNINNIRACFSRFSGQVLLATALVNARSHTGSLITLRCLIDQGSQASFLTEAAVQLLGLRKIPHKSSIIGLGSDHSSSVASKARVEIEIESRHCNFKICVQAFVLNKLTSVLPERNAVVNLSPEVSKLVLADPFFATPNKIDMLLGADVYGQILLEGLIKNSPSELIAQNTQLGWILSGPIQSRSSSSTIWCNHIHQNDEYELMKKFWELESDQFASDKSLLTEEEIKCENIYSSTTRRDSSGRYIVHLPFRTDDPNCKYGNSKAIAIKQFNRLENRLLKNPKLKAEYAAVIEEYKRLGHVETVPSHEEDLADAVYLPHHAVIREDKDTTKVRVVFNASCPGTNGITLNDELMVGPSLQPDLRHIIMRWRQYPICLVADIIKMYRQVKISELHTNFQRFVWREDPDQRLQHLRLLRVTFGTALAPYLAVKSLQQVAHDDGLKYPLAAERVLREFYMDDFMSGCFSVEEGKQIYKEITQLLQGGGFVLQKWSSNSEEIINEINEDVEDQAENLKLKIDEIMKILGLTWNRRTDEFEYVVKLPQLSPPVTKRKVISEISRLFDPVGWLAPVIISAKVFIQKLWLSGIEWDVELPPQLLKDWLKYRSELDTLTKFSIPRWININHDDKVRELHGFCDASNVAFAAVVYLRVVNSIGEVNVALIASKTKVAPIKQVSIPRLELCGAVLLTRLLLEVSQVMGIEKSSIHAWTDSQIVLVWLQGQPSRWKTFVANRVSEIITSLEPQQWQHVSTKDNPADCASRGSTQWDVQLWKEGPKWLQEKDINFTRGRIEDTDLEERKMKICLINTHSDEADPEEEIYSRFSSLRRLLRVTALCKRLIKRMRKKEVEDQKDWITSFEIRESLKICVKRCQEKHFGEELADLRNKKEINKKSKLVSLNPIVDEDGILRVGGRLQQAILSDERKHPIILPRKSQFTTLIIADAHERTFHGGPQLMQNYLQSKYWIIGAKDLIRLCVRKCVRCVRYTARIRHQLMGQIPVERSTACRRFLRSGVDYAGPINIRTSKGRGNIVLIVVPACSGSQARGDGDPVTSSTIVISTKNKSPTKRYGHTDLHLTLN